MKNKDIACLVRNAQRDPDSHFDALYRASKDLVYYLACGMLSDVGHAADITQEVMLKVYQNLGNLGAPEAYNGWLNRIVVNTINDHWKKTAHQDGGLLFDEISVDASAGHDQGFPSHYNNAAEKTSHARGVGMHAPNAGLPPAEVSLTMQIPQPLDELVDNQVVAQIVFNEIRALPKNQREALLLRYYSDLDTDEIARALGVSENTATVRLFRARESLRERLRTIEATQKIKLYSADAIAIGALLRAIKPAAPNLPTAWSVNAPKGQLFWLNPAVLTVAAVVTVGLAGGIAVRAGIMNGRGTNDSRNVGQSTQDVASHAAETTIPAPVNETTITSTPATATAPNPTTMLSPVPVEAPMSNPSDTGKTTEKKSSPSQKSEKPKSSTSKQTDKKPTLSFGTILTFGSWNNTPLDWQILKVDKTKVTLISKYVITAGAFRLDWEAPDATSWLTSDIRTWLNSSFKIETPALILDTNGDALRLLSAAEAKRYFPTQTSRTAQPLPGSSEVSGLNGDAPYQIAGKANWWLSDANGTEVRYVSWEGKVSSQLPLYTTTGIRPVLTISTDDARRLL